MKKRKLLLVEDEPLLQEVYSKLLEPEFEVLPATNGREAWEHLDKGDVCCMVLDIMLPDVNGLELLREVRDNGHDLPAIIVTGRSCLDYAEQAANLGVSGYLKKPFERDELLKRINSICENSVAKEEGVHASMRYAHPKLKAAVAYIKQNYSRQISVGSVAKDIGVSQIYLGRLFRQKLGTTFTKYLNSYRVEKAKHLIENTDKIMVEIMEEVGFKTEQHFFKQFKRFAGCTPSNFRK